MILIERLIFHFHRILWSMKKTVYHHGDLTKEKVPDSEKIRKMASDKMRTGFTKIKMYLKEPRSSDEMWCIFRVATPGEPPPSQEEKAGKVEQTTGTKKNGNLDRKEKNFSQQAEEGDGGGRCQILIFLMSYSYAFCTFQQSMFWYLMEQPDVTLHHDTSGRVIYIYIFSIYRNIHTQLICWLFKRVWKTLLHYIEIDILKSQTLKRKPVVLSIEIKNFIKLYKKYFCLSIMVLKAK